MERRRFLKALGVTGASTLTAMVARSNAAADDREAGGKEPVGVLVDTTRCLGCRYCEEVCAEANGLPVPDTSEEVAARREPTESQWCVVNRFPTDEGEIFARKQCMHCLQPACATACLTRAMVKTEEGPVIWRESKCMGCRFCMISCPFDIPKFEYDSPVPKIQKCSLCWKRLRDGEQPACVENCPAEALLFGKRSELIREGRKRILEEPERYFDHIYGEHEAGGTTWMYLAAMPFEKLGFKSDIRNRPYPELTAGFLYSVPFILTLWPAFLLALSNARTGNSATAEDMSNERSGTDDSDRG